ncbi:MAG: hypothetical protein Q4G65_15385 [bacterium]|nr:hypothetical protein [bacterium]
MHARSGQAMIEFALGLFALTLILSALLAFGAIIPKTTQLQSEVRRAAGRAAESGEGSADGALPVRILDNLPADARDIPAVELVTEQRHETVDLTQFAAEWLFPANGDNEFRIHEEASMPAMGVPTFEINQLEQEGGLL